MRRSIFYSWQSDLPNSGNRSLIEDALQRALRSIRRDETASVDPVLDRDTAGIPGSPSIADSIFAKISLADVFVGDVSIINPGSEARPTPNPNVLIELGYAIAQLGWDRIILVQNTCFGAPENLPFDLRGRRVVAYTLDSINPNRAEARALLQGRLENALRTALLTSTTTSLPTGPDAPLWWGKWESEEDSEMNGGNLFIREIGPSGFLFDITVYNGAHSGKITSHARLVSSDVAYARIPNGENVEMGELIFRRDIHQGRRTLSVEESASCHYWRGMGGSFSMDFVRLRDPLFDCGVVNEIDLNRLNFILGEHYDAFRQRFQGISDHENSDEFEAKVAVGGARGLYTIMEGILMIGCYGEIWTAFIDDEVVRYFTTQLEWKETLPITIDKWRERFKGKEVVLHSLVGFTPRNEYE